MRNCVSNHSLYVSRLLRLFTHKVGYHQLEKCQIDYGFDRTKGFCLLKGRYSYQVIMGLEDLILFDEEEIIIDMTNFDLDFC